MSIERWRLNRSPSSYRLGLVADQRGDWVKYADVIKADANVLTNCMTRIKELESLIKTYEIERNDYLDARFRTSEAHVVTMGKLIEAQARIKELEAFKDKIDGAGGYP